MRHALSLPATAALLALASGACDSAGDARAAHRIIPGPPDTVVTSESGTLGQVVELLVAPDGTLYASDRARHTVHAVPPSGGPLLSLGREGDGPGELRFPSAMGAAGDTLFVVDRNRNLLVLFRTDGSFLEDRDLPGRAFTYPPSLSADGQSLALPTGGRDSTMARVFLHFDADPVEVGTPAGPPEPLDLGALRRTIARREVPIELLNHARALPDPGGIWLVNPARGSVERYDTLGALLWSTVLDQPEMPDIFQRFIDDNAALPPRRVAELRYILDAHGVDGELWLLLGSSATGAATVLGMSPEADGARRLDVPGVIGAMKFAADVSHGWLYFVTDRAELLRVPWARTQRGS